MKKIFLNILLVLLAMFTLVACSEDAPEKTKEEQTAVVTPTVTPDVTETPEPDKTPVVTPTPTEGEKEYGATVYNELTTATSKEARKCFNFFWATANTMQGKGLGLIPDRWPNNGLASIASVGYGLTAFPIGVVNGWITYEKAYDRTLTTLKSMQNLETVEGFYYHFYNYYSGDVAPGSEVSGIDTAIFLCGALFAGQYFGGEIQEIAQEIYDEVNWPWYVNPKTKQFYMSYDAETGKHSGKWDVYGEQLMMYFLGAGSKTHPIGVDVYNSFQRIKGTYGGYTHINSWFGSIFTYQFSHAWIDFRNIVDADGVNWFDNSVKATYSSYQYCVDNASKFKTFSETSWGLTACDGPDGYNGLYGAAPSGNKTNNAHKTDGTVALCGAVGSIVFAPEIVVPTIDYYYTALGGKLFQGYGFVDSYNLENGEWIAEDVIGIDKGISLLMIENYRSEFVWEVFMDCEFIAQAIEVLEFTKTK